MSQFALPLAWPTDARDAEFLISASNAAAVRMLERRADWPVHATILVGPPRSGRSTLARIIAARIGAEVIDDAPKTGEERLFHAWNHAQATQAPLILVADAAPPAWQVALPDLRSRLGATPVATIDPPDDALIALLLERGFERRHLDARPDLVAWLVARVERSHVAVEETLEQLARAAAEGQRRLSIPLARTTLADGGTLIPRSHHE